MKNNMLSGGGSVTIVTSVGDPGLDTQVPSEKAVRDALDITVASEVTGPVTTTENKIPQWSSTTKDLKDGIVLTTSVANPGVDTQIPTEKAVRTSLGLTSATKTSGYTVLDTDSLLTILISCSSADITIILPSAITKRKLKFVKLDATAYRGIISRAGSDTIALVGTYIELVTQNQTVNIESDGVSNWYY